MDIQILSAISGRLRLRIPRLNHDSNYAAQIDGEIKVLRFVTGVRINPLASSITITYSTKTISDIEAKKTILEEIAQAETVVSTANEATPQVEELSSNELSETSLPEPVETIASETAPETLQSEEPSPNEVASEQISSIEEVSPLQESASTSAGIEAQNNDTVTPTVDRVGETLRLTSSALARRLGISAQALTVRSSQPDFTKWSMTKDPEHIGWVFIKSLNKFYSVNSL
jgi:hypothetical protein